MAVPGEGAGGCSIGVQASSPVKAAMGAERGGMLSLLEDRPVPGLVVEVLYVEDCPTFAAALALVQRVVTELGVDAEVRTTVIGDQAAAERARFVGSPTVRVNGRDVDPDGELDAEYTTECRLCWHEHRLAGHPQERSIREALLRAAGRT
jgi:hypothetical protein